MSEREQGRSTASMSSRQSAQNTDVEQHNTSSNAGSEAEVPSRHSPKREDSVDNDNVTGSPTATNTTGFFSRDQSTNTMTSESLESATRNVDYDRMSQFISSSLKVELKGILDECVSGVVTKITNLEEKVTSISEDIGKVKAAVNDLFPPGYPPGSSLSDIMQSIVSSSASPPISAGNRAVSPESLPSSPSGSNTNSPVNAKRSKTPVSRTSASHLSKDSRESILSTSPQQEVSGNPLFSKTPSVFEVPCMCQLQYPPLPLILHDEVKFLLMVQQPTSGIAAGHVESYTLKDGQRSIQNEKTFTDCKKNICSTVLLRSNKLTILAAEHDVLNKSLKLMLNELNSCSKAQSHIFSWGLISNSKYLTTQFDLKNSVCASYRDGIVVISILKQATKHAQSPDCMVFHLFSPIKDSVAGKYWKVGYLQLESVEDRYQIQSCVVISNYIYCSVLLPGVSITIHKVDLTPLQQSTPDRCSLSNQAKSVLTDVSLQTCQLSVLNQTLISITFYNADNKTIIEAKQYSDDLSSSSLKCQHEFPFTAKVLATSVSSTVNIPNTLIIVYHNSEVNKCYLEKINMVTN